MKKIRPKIFIIDVDGVMTTGHFLYSSKGKVMKIFGPDDNDGLSLLKTNLEIRFITGAKKGFPISAYFRLFSPIAKEYSWKVLFVFSIYILRD
jgi:hypothetical protein